MVLKWTLKALKIFSLLSAEWKFTVLEILLQFRIHSVELRTEAHWCISEILSPKLLAKVSEMVACHIS